METLLDPTDELEQNNAADISYLSCCEVENFVSDVAVEAEDVHPLCGGDIFHVGGQPCDAADAAGDECDLRLLRLPRAIIAVDGDDEPVVGDGEVVDGGECGGLVVSLATETPDETDPPGRSTASATRPDNITSLHRLAQRSVIMAARDGVAAQASHQMTPTGGTEAMGQAHGITGEETSLRYMPRTSQATTDGILDTGWGSDSLPAIQPLSIDGDPTDPQDPLAPGLENEHPPITASTQADHTFCMGKRNFKGDPFAIPRRPQKRDLDPAPNHTVQAWFDASKIQVGDIASTPEQRMMAMRLCYTWRDIFVSSLNELSITDLVQHPIDLVPDAAPHRTRQVKWKPIELAWTFKLFPQMEEAGLIQRTFSDWAHITLFGRSPGSLSSRNVALYTITGTSIAKRSPSNTPAIPWSRDWTALPSVGRACLASRTQAMATGPYPSAKGTSTRLASLLPTACSHIEFAHRA